MEMMTHVLVLGLILVPLMTFFRTGLEMMIALFGMSSALIGMPF